MDRIPVEDAVSHTALFFEISCHQMNLDLKK